MLYKRRSREYFSLKRLKELLASGKLSRPNAFSCEKELAVSSKRVMVGLKIYSQLIDPSNKKFLPFIRESRRDLEPQSPPLQRS